MDSTRHPASVVAGQTRTEGGQPAQRRPASAGRRFSPAELVLRLHHRTVLLHPFQNGNGRHARIVAEELALALGLGEDCFSWGGHLGVPLDQQRAAYLAALRRLDENRDDIEPLLRFAIDPEAEDAWP